ncbi:MAG: hypothetical protein R3228_19110, partial [Halioglobus sp.]|nr:hypothetical protein [Halioglobus sp.]
MASEEKPQREPATHLVIVPHTHWDREWYRPFETFRHRLVHLVDTLLDILESDPAFLFHFDGQTIVLDDYLAIRPQNEDRLRRQLQSGRIRIGPWRVLPDQFLVSGESLIRNLQQGHADCARWGVQPSAVGYAPDMFGHAAATPQVFAGFGIDCAVVWRGVGPDVRDTRFMWQGADGSRLFTIYLADSYSNGANLPTNGDALMARLDEIRAAQRDFCHIPPLLIMNGSDHLEPQPAIPALMDAVVARRPDWTWELASIESFVEMARGHAGDLPLHVGELRHPWRANILPGVTSVRSYQKQADFMASRLLEKYVEPLTAWAQQLGGDRGNADFTAYAWRLLTENHPHDSICGCSVDAVHDEMDTRYEKVMQLGLTLQNDAISQLAEALDAASLATGFEQALVTYTAARPALQLLDTA